MKRLKVGDKVRSLIGDTKGLIGTVVEKSERPFEEVTCRFEGFEGHNCMGKYDINEYYYMLPEWLEHVEDDKYRWHDLRKNPKDLPKKTTWYCIKVKSSDDYRMVYACGKEFKDKADAWREIEPFDSEVE